MHPHGYGQLQSLAMLPPKKKTVLSIRKCTNAQDGFYLDAFFFSAFLYEDHYETGLENILFRIFSNRQRLKAVPS